LKVISACLIQEKQRITYRHFGIRRYAVKESSLRRLSREDQKVCDALFFTIVAPSGIDPPGTRLAPKKRFEIKISKQERDMNGATQQIALQEKSISQTEKTYVARAYAAQSPTSGMAPFTIRRRAPRPQDVQIDILYCGVCHSDLHQVRNQWQNAMPTVYPCVPGHEIVGRVVKTGSAVKKFKEGDIAAVGCMVDSCRTCAACRAGEEQYCDSFPTSLTTRKIGTLAV
jgi:hypothetical protein